MTITLEDILTKDPDDILKKITQEEFRSNLEETFDRNNLVKIKEKLDSFFKSDKTSLFRGQVVHAGDYFVTVISILKSSGRVFFQVNDTDVTFSLPLNYVLGEEGGNFPFKKGDLAKFKDQIWMVRSVNPASRNVVLKHDSLGLKKITINKIERIAND